MVAIMTAIAIPTARPIASLSVATPTAVPTPIPIERVYAIGGIFLFFVLIVVR